jgi:putative transcriptional regulator
MRLVARSILLALLLFPAALPRAAYQGADNAASLAGRLLVAEERLADPNFSQSVVLMVHHDAEGAMGLVVNRRYGRVLLAELLRQLGREPGAGSGEIDLYYGGPVQPGIGFVLHGPPYATAATRQVTAELSMTGDPRAVADLAEGHVPGAAKLLLGYAGWGPGQLESELLRKDWLTLPADAALVLTAEPERMWKAALDRRGTDL